MNTENQISPEASGPRHHQGLRASLLLGALGVVYGDIGTSPLYAFKECLKSANDSAATLHGSVLGILSLIVWSLILVVTLKYLLFVMRADNQGEGGILALLALALPEVSEVGLRKTLLVVGVAGAALLYGDGVITPAISVLSAVEGLSVATPLFEPYVVPLSLVILIGLFSIQSQGSGRIGGLFGLIMVIFFVTLAGVGLWHISDNPQVLNSFSPAFGLSYLKSHGWTSLAVLGSVFLAVTGAEALYADMGHFGRAAIRFDWFLLVLPALILNYFGQGALVLSNPSAASNPFFLMFPPIMLYPAVALSTVATVIASQALISGAFTLSQQATLLGLLPRLTIRQTSQSEIGQVYVPQINWLLAIGVVGLILGFRSSDKLASAYGIAVVSTMLSTTILAAVVAHRRWKWSLPATIIVSGGFLMLDSAFLIANIGKIPHGGWFPLLLGGLVFALMMTWREGRRVIIERLGEENSSLEIFLEKLSPETMPRVEGLAVYLSSRRDIVPSALALNLHHNKVLHEQIILLNVEILRVPFANDSERVSVTPLSKGFTGVHLRFGFFEKPDVLGGLARYEGSETNLKFDLSETSFFIGRELPVPAVRPDLNFWQEPLYEFLTRNAVSAPEYYFIPAQNVVELGTRVEL